MKHGQIVGLVKERTEDVSLGSASIPNAFEIP